MGLEAKPPANASAALLDGFVRRLRDAAFSKSANGNSARSIEAGGALSVRSILETSDLSPDELADQVAAYFERPRVALAELLSAPPLTHLFTRRFLREAMIFPYDAGDGRAGLAVAD
ncbi:MAG TPA: type II/IV secretion system protein, partial [Roseiarcus sp.]|nr:type II/IV secretion system protein [Roseiarcus sp.]